MGSLEKQATWTRPVRWGKKNYKHVQWRTHHHYDTNDEPVIAKGPDAWHSNATPANATTLPAC